MKEASGGSILAFCIFVFWAGTTAFILSFGQIVPPFLLILPVWIPAGPLVVRWVLRSRLARRRDPASGTLRYPTWVYIYEGLLLFLISMAITAGCFALLSSELEVDDKVLFALFIGVGIALAGLLAWRPPRHRDLSQKCIALMLGFWAAQPVNWLMVTNHRPLSGGSAPTSHSPSASLRDGAVPTSPSSSRDGR